MTATPLTTLATPTDWRERARSLTLETRAFIGGQYRPARGGQTFARVNPATGKHLADITACQEVDIDDAVQAARAAFESGVWRDRSPLERKTTLLRFAELIRQNAEELALLETLDTGKAIGETTRVDAHSLARDVQWYAESIDKLYDEIAPNGVGTLVLVTREAVGVVAAVVPWNYPLIIAGWKLGPALAAGNSVILKPAEQSSLGAIRLGALGLEAGLPQGVFQVTPGLGSVAGRALGLHPDVDAIGFTGSTEVGRKFLEYSAASNLKRVGLELGGKSAQIVTPDADLDRAAMYVAYGIWYNQGETCNAGSRLIVHESVREALLDKLRPWAEKLAPGDPLEHGSPLGSLIDEAHLEKVLEYVRLGVQEGARVVIGGKRTLEGSGGAFMQNTVLDGATNTMRVAREEIFGPVLVVISYTELDEAVRLANDSDYGLAAAVWSRNLSTAHKVARRLRAGTVWVNSFDHTSVNAPFGGYKQSGHGRDKSLHAFDKYTELKTTWIELYE